MSKQPLAPTSEFRLRTVLKRDVFSEIGAGAFAADPERLVTYRRVSHAPAWARPLAWHLARREIRALQALEGVANTPELLAVDRSGLYRSWIEGTPLHVAKPFGNEAYFRDAKRLLRELRSRRVTHNDLAKPQNWLITPDGRAALIDMQLATVFGRATPLFRLLARKSLPARLWMKTGKPVYNSVTRGIFGWSDGEGTKDRMDDEGRAILRSLAADPEVAAVSLSPFPHPRHGGIGIYAFVEPAPGADPARLEKRLAALPAPRPDLVQIVERLPRDDGGRIREDLLRLVAINQPDRIDILAGEDAALAALAHAIARRRKNLTDRRLRG